MTSTFETSRHQALWPNPEPFSGDEDDEYDSDDAFKGYSQTRAEIRADLAEEELELQLEEELQIEDKRSLFCESIYSHLMD